MVAVTLIGCSGVPYAPAPTLIPSPSKASARPGEPSFTTPPQQGIDLQGLLVVQDDGQTAGLHARVELGQLGPVEREGDDRGTRQLSVDGNVTLTNATDRINVPAASVALVFQAGYPRRSPVCAAVRPPEGVEWGRYCWYLVAEASPYDSSGGLVALQPGEQRVLTVTPAVRGSLGRLHVAEPDTARVDAALRQPAVVVVLTSAVNVNQPQLRGGCRNLSRVSVPTALAPQPTAQPPPPPPVPASIALIAATSAITCEELQYVGP